MKKKVFRGEILFDIIILVVMAGFFFSSFSFNEKNRLFPLIFGGVGIVLAAINLIRDIRQLKKGDEVSAEGFDFAPFALIAVLFAYLAGIYLAGSVIATCLFTFLYVVFWGKQRWTTGLICSGISFVVIYFAFGMLMKMPLYKGLLGLI